MNLVIRGHSVVWSVVVFWPPLLCPCMLEIIAANRAFMFLTREFLTYPHHTYQPKEIPFSSRECLAIKIELQRFLDKSITVPSEHETCEFISTIFVRQKADGSFRLIFNLRRLNEHIVYHHFKMESLKSVIQLMEKDCFMASVDLRDAYYSVPCSSMPRNTLRSHGVENCTNLLACQMVCAVLLDCSQSC